MRTALVLASLALAACARAGDTATDTARDTAAAPGTGAVADPDRATGGGGGVPAGYAARTDKPDQQITDAKYAPGADGGWEVTTGPAHVVWAAKDTASGRYTVRATIEQLQAPAHPEAYGIILGGHDIDGPAQSYTYFLVRGDGRYTVKVRDGDDVRSLVDFTESPAVPKADATGKARYALEARVATDSVRFLVNGAPVTTIAAKGLATNGIAGVRINHNLHVRVTPLAITRQ